MTCEPAPTIDYTRSYTPRLRAAYHAYLDHLRDTHNVIVDTPGKIDRAHWHAHQQDGTRWHDAWRQPEPGQVL